VLDDMCKKVKSKIKENREKFKNLESEFGFVFVDDGQVDENPTNRLALVVIDDHNNRPR
jgi:cell division protein FtsX